MRKQTQAEAPGVSDLVGRLVDGLGELLAQHVALARVEVGEEVQSVARVAGTVALVTPLLVVGYALLCLALAFALSSLVGLASALALVGAANLLAGGIGLWAVRTTLRRPRLEETAQAVRESASMLLAETREVTGVH